MAQVVGYFEDHVTFEEGPFVIVWASGWRIECEIKGGKCPVLPDLTIYKLVDSRFPGFRKTGNKDVAAKVCDFLNDCVKQGKVSLQGKTWVCMEFEGAS